MIPGFPKPWKPVFIHFIIPKFFKRFKKNLRTLCKHIIFVNMWITIFENVLKALSTVLFFVRFFIYKIISHFYIIFCEDEDRKMMPTPIIKSRKAWIWISYLSQNMKWKCCIFLFSGKGIPKLQGRESFNIN